MSSSKKILTVGLTCVDIVTLTQAFPKEDIKVWGCTKQTWERGGNASNNASVLAQLGAKAEFLGTMAHDHLLSFFQDDMKSYGIEFGNCPIYENHSAPVSVVISSEESGSRTIIHNNGDLPELTFQYFQQTLTPQLESYAWVHIEGRNVEQLEKILEHLQSYNSNYKSEEGTVSATSQSNTQNDEVEPNYKRKILPISVEVEKVRISLVPLLKYADVAFVGREFAEFHGAKNFVEAAHIASKLCPRGTLVICPWGEAGAAFCIAQDNPKVSTVEAYPPEKVIDSLGAGDTFDAAVIFGLSRGLDIETSVRLGCKVAGAKIGFSGFRKIGEIAQGLPEYVQAISQTKSS